MTFWEAFREQTKIAAIGIAMALVFGAGIAVAYLLIWYRHYVVGAIFIVAAVIGTLALSARRYQRQMNRTDWP